MAPDREPRDPETEPASHPDHEDQLSPARALRKSAATGGGQRIGDNGPVGNPDTSFPAEPPPATADEPEPPEAN